MEIWNFVERVAVAILTFLYRLGDSKNSLGIGQGRTVFGVDAIPVAKWDVDDGFSG
jgi:hypothetical protein